MTYSPYEKMYNTLQIFFFYEYDIHNKKRKILRKINYKQRNLDDKRSERH